MRKFDDFLDEQKENEEFKVEYEKQQPELNAIRAIAYARAYRNLTQKQLAERSGIDQADICKIEKGTRNPSIAMLQRLAEAMDMVLKIEFIPKQAMK